MKEDPDIVKILKEEEKLGLFTCQSQGSYDRLDTSGEVFEHMPDKSINVMKNAEKTHWLHSDSKKEKDGIFEAISDWVCLLDKKHRIIRTNSAVEKIIGIPRYEIIGKICCEIVHGSKKPLPGCPLQKMLHTHHKETKEIQVPNSDHWLKITVDPVTDEEDNVTGAVHIVSDITRQKKTEKELENIFNLSPDMICVCTPEGEFVKVNNSCERVLGYTVDEILVLGWAKLVHPDDVERTKSEVDDQLKGKSVRNFINRFRCKDGTYKTLEWQATPVLNGIVYATARDITERKKIEEEIRESEEKYKDMIELAPDGIVTVDLKGTVLSCNTALEKITGYSKDDLIGKNFTKLPTMRTRDFPKYLKILGSIIRGKVPKPFEVIWMHNDGTPHFSEIHISLMKKEGKKIGLQIMVRDITERKKTEEKIRKQNIKLKRLDRIKTDFLNTTSHELRTPMAAIKGYIQMLLKQRLGDITPEQEDALKVVLRNTDRLDHLVQDILDISRLESGTMKFIAEKTNVLEMIKEVIETMQTNANIKNIKINTELEEIPELVIDKQRIKQVLMNLIDNSIKFSPYDSTINLYTKRQKDNILFEVQDFGRGIPKKKQKKIFERFYQVDSGMDRKFGGVGLGLTISQGMVNAHGGRIWVDSTLGKGSTFKFSLPVQSVKDAKERFKEVEVFALENNK